MLHNSTLVQSLNSRGFDENDNQDLISENIVETVCLDNYCVANKSGDMQPIAKEFRQHYERKLMEICERNNPECVQAKMKLQEDWIRDLTEQNDMLIKAVIELESEATERVKMLEGKLKDSAVCACEVMNSWRGRVIADNELNQTSTVVEQLESDVCNLLKLLRRSRNLTNTCALTEGLCFHNVSAQELAEALESDLNSNGLIVGDLKSHNQAEMQQVQEAAVAKDRKIEQLQMKLALSANNRFEESDQFRLMQENYSILKQTMQDVRDALTAEVADKHDAIVTLRRDVQLLEEQCKRADQQTHFKDDIIKELRKDLKHLKQEETSVVIATLRTENNRMLLGIKELILNACNVECKPAKIIQQHLLTLLKIIQDDIKNFTAFIQKQRISILVIEQQGSCTGDCPARMRVAVLESENKDLRAAINQAQMELEQLENKTENYLDGDSEKFARQLQDWQVDVIPAVTPCEAQLDHQEIHNIFIGSKPITCSKSTSKKSSAFELEDVINNLSESVSQMMMRNATNKSCNKRIQDLENQLAESMKNKDLDIDEERNRRNVEINNLIRTIQEQEDTLQSLQFQSKNLTECVNFYLNSVKILQESEDKHKAQVAQQKVTIGNLQEALMKVKTQLEELQLQRSIGAPEIDILHSIISKQTMQFHDIDKYCKQCSKEYLSLSNIVALLRDENLALAVEYFNHFQDKCSFSANLQKYRQLSQDAQMNISALKGTIKELKEDHNQMYKVIECQKAELRICSQELIRLQELLQTEAPIEEVEMTNIDIRLQDALKTNALLIAEITILKSKLSSESKSGNINQERISELQSIICDKNVEIDRWHTTAVDFKRQLDQAAQKQAELEHNINSMQRSIAKSDIVSVIQNEETDVCREEVDVCLGELRQLKGKINLEASIYSQKMEELQTFKNRCTLQNGTIEVLRRDLKDERIRQKGEILNLKQQIRELKERDTILDIDNRKHLEHIKHIEDKVNDLSERERQLISASSTRESELAEKATKSRSEEIRLVSEVTQLEQRAAELDAEVRRLRSELEKVTIICADRQAEMASLKTEVNLLLQRQGKIKAENGKLRAHVNNLQRTKRSVNGDSEKLMGQLDNCLRQLEQLHGDKEFLSIQNEQLQQCICTRDSELLQTQEQLDQIRSNRDEVCEESRTVVTNVRQWLHHQHTISEQVKDKVRRLERENRDLQETVNEMSVGAVYAVPCRMRGGSPVRSRSSNLIYPCNCNLNSRGGTQSPASVTSVASGSSADDSSVNYSSGSENDFDIKLAKQISTPEVWLHKVENMTAELQRSNSYWKRKLYKTKSIDENKNI